MDRLSFGTINTTAESPDLLDIQRSSCIEFLQERKFMYFYEVTTNEWSFNYIFLSKFFKILEMIFFIKPYTKIKFKRVHKFEKKIYQQIICSKFKLKSI